MLFEQRRKRQKIEKKSKKGKKEKERKKFVMKGVKNLICFYKPKKTRHRDKS